MTKHITVGYDGTNSSADAVAWAADQAATRGAALRIVSCFQLPVTGAYGMGYGYGEAIAYVEESAEKSVNAIAETVKAAHPDLDVSTFITPGPAATVLVEGLEPDDLVVVGSSGHEGAAAFWLGSTPRRVVRHSPCAVAVVRGPATPGRPNRVVVGIDGSEASNVALDWAGGEADRQQVPLLVVHGWSYPYIPVDTASAQGRDLTEVDAACTLDGAVERASQRFATEVSGCLVEATPANALLQTVRDGDLLVIGTRGRGAIRSGLFGSTVNSVLERAAVAVIVVPPRESEHSE